MTTRADFCGLPVTASPADAAAWDAAAQDFLGYHGPSALKELVRTTPHLAVARALLAMMAASGGAPGVDPAEELGAARGSLDGASERERAFVATVAADAARTPGDGRQSPWVAYLRDHPSDLVGRFAVMIDVLFAFREDRAQAVQALVAEGLRVNGRHPALASAEAMLAQEDADLDRAHDLAAEVLREHPSYVSAAHVTTHVHYERGDHPGGLAWLERWVARDLRPGCEYAPHISWHAGLHELALDDRDAVLRRLAAMVGPGAAPAWLLSNGASYLWRLKLAGVVAMDADPTDEPFRLRTRAVSSSPPMLFAGWNAVLGLGCLGDVAALAALERGDVQSRAPGVREVLPGLAGAVRALLEDRPAEAADALLAQRQQWYRVGGSRAQREVLEDTLLAALVRAGRTELAAEVLRERLDRRPSAGDSARLAALAVPLRSSPSGGVT